MRTEVKHFNVKRKRYRGSRPQLYCIESISVSQIQAHNDTLCQTVCPNSSLRGETITDNLMKYFLQSMKE